MNDAEMSPTRAAEPPTAAALRLDSGLPGWMPSSCRLDRGDDDAQAVAEFEDVRQIQAQLEAAGIELLNRADPDSTGPESLMLTDPEGNVILIDQHVPRPGA